MNNSHSSKYLYRSSPQTLGNFELVMGFPACESFGLSSLGYLWLFKTLDECGANDGVNVSQIYTDSKIVPDYKNANAISFSISYEMDFMGVFEILEKLKIPFSRSERENSPLLFAGGPVVTSNPMPFADFFDFFLIGDGEFLLKSVVNVMKNNREKNKSEVLSLLAKIEGVYVPGLNNQAKKVTVPLTQCVYTPVLSEKSYFSDTFIIEVERGCYNRCGFCLASYINLPVRFIDYDEIIEKIEYGLEHTNNIALLGAQVSAHPRFNDICLYLINKIESGTDININFSSLRVDAINAQVVKLLKLSGQKKFTIAIEAASERLRKIINKNIKEEQIFNALKIAAENGLRGVKIYCMIGLPAERDEDVRAFVDLAKRLKSQYRGFEITFSFSSFIPKPHTPFQWMKRDDNITLEKKQKYLSKELAKIGVKSKFSSLKWDYYQTLISRGDEKLGKYLLYIYQNGGKLGAYKFGAKEFGINMDFYVTRQYSLDEDLPWDNIVIEQPGKELLKNEYKRLMKRADLK